ncbi:tyrosine-protein phosphatase 99A-like, partial [Amphibalanus amphitrite]|uniref:tyrosine-protein phosphatase 99A-like n=1 Tax=Amphibalanus amphitrite TaxID=1232801 RepID=UPI001C8FDB87
PSAESDAGQVYEIRIQGATISRLSENKLYKGQQSLPRKVRMGRGCEEIQLYSTWQHRPQAALAGPQLTAVFVVACLLGIVGVAASGLIWRRRQRRPPTKVVDKTGSASGGVLSGWAAPSHEAVPAHLFGQHVHQLRAESADGYRREWETLQMAAPLTDGPRTNGTNKSAAGAGPDAHSDKYQLTRVAVSSRLYRSRAVPAAYYVDGYQKARAFIVTERPAAGAADVLWRIAWEQGVTGMVIIGTLEKAARLWPDWGACRPFGDLQLELREELQLAACCVRQLAVSKLKGKSGGGGRQERLVTVFQYTHWPEYGLPEDTLPLLDFAQRALRHEPPIKSPLMLISGRSFCGAGLYLGLVTLLTQLNYRGELGVFSYWQHIIGQCPSLLPTVEEYSLLHDCLLERVTAGETLVTRDGARRYIEHLEATADGFPYPPAEKQYKQAIAMDANLYLVAAAAKPCNEPKNRSISYLPMETSRVRLKKTAATDGGDYINASWLPGYRLMQEYILTQHPLASTVLDFWQMLWDYRVTTVTCLSPEDFGTFWPLEEEELTGANFVVRYMSESADCSDTYKSSWIIRSFLMESTEGDDDLTVRIVHLPLWPEECSTDAILEGVLGVTEIQGQRHTPLVVMDRYGGTEGASFCVLSTALRQLRQEGSFDIFTYAKLYHQRRPGIWKTMREFLYLYHAVEAWLSVRRSTALYRSDSCTSICQNRSELEVKLSGVDGVIV